MPIQNTIASQLLSGAITAAAKASLMLSEGCSPAITEAAQIYAAVAHVASELYDLPEGAFRQRVLLALAQESAVRTDRPNQPPVGSTVREGQCEHVEGTGYGLRRCILHRAHDGRHQCVGVAR